MRDPITRSETDTRNGRTYLLGLTDIGDWKLLAVYDDAEDIERWCSKVGEHGPSFRQWFTEKGLLAA